MLTLADLREHLSRLAGIFPGGHVVGGLDTIEKMVGSATSLLGGGLGRADVELAVHRHRIAVDDFAVELLSERQRQRRFATRRGAEDYHQRRLKFRRRWLVVFIGSAHVQRRLQWMLCQ